MVDLRGENMTGVDVAQLEVALTALGFNEDGDVTLDDEYTDRTEMMVENWQESIGATEDGIVDLGEVVFLPRQVEIVSVAIEVGSSVTGGRTVITVTGPTPMTGDDVLQLETALSALGFDDDGALVVDGEFTTETKAAVTAWQEAAGAERDGVVDLGEVVFLPDAVRIASLVTPAGGRVNQGGAVLNVTASDIVVIAELSAADQGIVAEGDVVTVELPDNTRTNGTVESVATVATRLPDGTTIFEVTIVLDDPVVAGDLDEAPVDVDIVTDSVAGVAAVPVTALLALREGGYAVEVDLGNGTTGLVPVEPGFFADGLVEVESDVLEPGMRVVVP